VKSALALTGDTVYAGELKAEEASTVRGGGGVVNLPRADTPLVFADPVALSFGLVASNTTVARSTLITDAGGGAGPWSVAVERQTPAAGATVTAPLAVTVPGQLQVQVATGPAADAEHSGYLVLTRDAERRRIPYWFRTGDPALADSKVVALRRPGAHKATTKGGASRIARYRYPERPTGQGFSAELPGPERVFRFTLPRSAANFGVVVTSRARGVRVEPRVVRAGDERRLTGYPALPFNLNPYLRIFGDPVLAAGAILPAAGSYDIVFDSPSSARAGAFAFRFWINDTTPPFLGLQTRRVRRGRPVVLGAADGGAGVYPASLVVHIDGEERRGSFAAGRVLVPTAGLRKGRHTLRVQISDYQESRNMENVGRILPNTRILTTSFVVL